ncbi:MAG: SBBP repeat-containing protein, partial [Candidatus Zixiibacteriota bacterium]
PVTTGVFQDFRYGPQDVFVAKMPLELSKPLTYGTYIGGDSKDYGKDITVDIENSPYITGWTQSTDFPANNDTLGASDAFVTKLYADGSDIEYSRLLGGERRDRGYGIAVDDSLRAYVTGRTDSPDFDTAGIFHIPYTGTDSSDAFFARLDDVGNSLTFSTCLGDTTSGAREGNDMGYGICVWSPPVFPVQIAYVTGKTDSDDLPNAFFTDYSGNYDAFLAMFAAADIEFPTAEINSIVPDSTRAGVEVEFSGTGSHATLGDDLSIITYRWESDIDGLFSDADVCTTSALSIGTHQISFMAQDDLFLWSNVALDTVKITDPANPPTAVIDSIKPEAVRVGDPVYFGGHGDDQLPGWIEDYMWTSNIDDSVPLSQDSAFDTPNLSPGVHTISFGVKDNEGNWSTPVTGEVYVAEAGEELWEISWWYPDYVGEFSLLMHDHYACTLFVTNISQYDQEFNFRVDATFLDYRWDPADSRADPPGGSLGLEKTCTLNDTADYPWGNLLVETFAAGETKRYVFATSNDWDWIPDWSLLNTVSMVLSFVPINYIPTIIELASYLVGYSDYEKAPTRIEYTYKLMGDAASTGLPDRVDTVYVRPEKMKHYKSSMFLAFVGARFSQAGWSALVKIPFPVGPIIAAVCFVVEAIFYAGSYLYYQSALDPQTDYTQYDNPRKPADIECYATAHAQEDNCYKYMTYRAMEQYAYAEALLGSYGKCVGALKANDVEWAAKQMAISYCYMDKATSNLDEINEFSHGLLSNIPLPDSMNVEAIKDSLEKGLPPIEVDIMQDFGQDPGTMADSFLAEYEDSSWESFATSYVGLTDTVYNHICSANVLMDSLYAEGIQGAVLGRVVQVKPDVVVQGTMPAPTCTLWVEFPGLMFPVSSYSFDSASMSATNDNSSSPEQVLIANIGVEDTDGDFVPELKIFFTAHMDSVGYRLESVYGDIITPSGDTLPDTLPFSTAAIIQVLSSSFQSNFSGCVMETESFEPVEDVQVRVCADPLFIIPPIYSDITDSEGRYSFDGKPDGNYYAEFTSATHADTTHGPVSIAANDTTKVCMLVEAIPGCCEGKTGNVDGDELDVVDIGDLTALIDYLFISFQPPECMDEANADGVGEVDIGDLTTLIDFLFIS